MWMSIFLRPTGSRFDRTERVTVAATFLYAAMLLNAVWFKVGYLSFRGYGASSVVVIRISPEWGYFL